MACSEGARFTFGAVYSSTNRWIRHRGLVGDCRPLPLQILKFMNSGIGVYLGKPRSTVLDAITRRTIRTRLFDQSCLFKAKSPRLSATCLSSSVHLHPASRQASLGRLGQRSEASRAQPALLDYPRSRHPALSSATASLTLLGPSARSSALAFINPRFRPEKALGRQTVRASSSSAAQGSSDITDVMGVQDTTERLGKLRELMKKEGVDVYGMICFLSSYVGASCKPYGSLISTGLCVRRAPLLVCT